ncbi:uncharacterized protein LOC110709156 isoform X1 [Chenopodium quinoa]|uniref:uncharacterized protein LOC110709156 isoform X1 n=1 Tax=Chenopodium quinoa TaxID=63459 RepID=UPI000B783BAB|nr:uncharacterized protein LOC110709156 isoform X1 [Chenopodium quinoa]
MNGFIRRIWGRFGIDRINLLPSGVYLVRFRSKENMEKVMNGGPVMFDSRQVIMKKWEPGINLDKEGVCEVPIWVRLPGLQLKFWGQSALMKIGQLIGKPVKTDKVTKNKEKLEYARLMIEVSVDGEYPTKIEFLDEVGANVSQRVIYEWKPIHCRSCTGMGHSESECPMQWQTQQDRRRGTRNVPMRRDWRPVQNQQQNHAQTATQVATPNAVIQENLTGSVITENRFDCLEIEENEVPSEIIHDSQRIGNLCCIEEGRVLYGNMEEGDCSYSLHG